MPKQILNFNHQQWLCFSELLKKGYSVLEVLDFMDVSKTQMSYIIKENQIEKNIIGCMKKQTQTYASFFITFMSLPQAIECAVLMHDFEMKMKHKLLHQCSYPLFIFVFSLISVYLFSSLIIPQLMHSFDVYSNNLSIQLVYVIEKLSVIIIFSFICVLFCILIVHFNHFLKQKFYHSHLGRYLCTSLASYQLARYLIVLHEKGLSSKQIFTYLLKLKHFSYLSTIIQSIHTQLVQGNDLYLVIKNHKQLNRRFKNAFMIGSTSGDLEKALSSYSLQQESIWNHQIRIVTIVIQFCAYLFVGILMICVYQIMLLPLEMVENL